MKAYFVKLLKNEVFQGAMFGLFAYMSYIAIVISVLQVPPEEILNSGLQEVLLVFEG